MTVHSSRGIKACSSLSCKDEESIQKETEVPETDEGKSQLDCI